MKKLTQEILIIIYLLTIIVACKSNVSDKSRSNYINENISVDEENVPLDSNQYYYPLNAFANSNSKPELNEFLVEWFSKHLYAMKEPLLFNKESDKEVFRFLWLRTFEDPISIRIEKENEEVMLYWKQCDGAGGYAPGILILNKKKKIDMKNWDHFKSMLDSMDYWKVATNDTKSSGLDGSRWILEGSTIDQYHVINRWSPSSSYHQTKVNKLLYQTCRYLIKLTDLNLNEKQIAD